MTDLIEKQQSFVQDDIPTRLGKLANNLVQIKHEVANPTNLDVLVNLIRESQFFIEWTVPQIAQMDIDQAAELVELGRTLAHWKFYWEKICLDTTRLAQVIQEAGVWSERVLEMSN